LALQLQKHTHDASAGSDVMREGDWSELLNIQLEEEDLTFFAKRLTSASNGSLYIYLRALRIICNAITALDNLHECTQVDTSPFLEREQSTGACSSQQIRKAAQLVA
jgi:hypothetical protein